jgi:hypothetical protein
MLGSMSFARIPTLRRCALLFVLVISTTCLYKALAQAPQPPATILIIRHGEKLEEGKDKHLSPIGLQRANLVPHLFLPSGVRRDLPTPQVLFATHESAHSNRPLQTIKPVATALQLPVNHVYRDLDYPALAQELLSGKYAGKVVLIVWHHGEIPQLAAALGATPPYNPWPAQQYDRIWRIDYNHGKATLKDLPQSLMPGDSK